MSDLEQLNNTLNKINKSLRLIHKELVISNLPDNLKQTQRDWFEFYTYFIEARGCRDVYEEKIDYFEKCMSKENLQNNQNYIDSKQDYKKYDDRMSHLWKLMEDYENAGKALGIDEIYCIGDNND